MKTFLSLGALGIAAVLLGILAVYLARGETAGGTPLVPDRSPKPVQSSPPTVANPTGAGSQAEGTAAGVVVWSVNARLVKRSTYKSLADLPKEYLHLLAVNIYEAVSPSKDRPARFAVIEPIYLFHQPQAATGLVVGTVYPLRVVPQSARPDLMGLGVDDSTEEYDIEVYYPAEVPLLDQKPQVPPPDASQLQK